MMFKAFITAISWLWWAVSWLPPVAALSRILGREHLINFGITYGYIRAYQIAYIAGRYAGYKTSLAFRIAYELVHDSNDSREYLYSNVKSIWNDDIEVLADIDNPRSTNSVIIFDEAGQFLDQRRDVKNLIAFLRKMGVVLLLPSVEPPVARVTRLTIEAMYVFPGIGLPLIVYRTTLRGTYHGDNRTSWFLWWQPTAVFGIYDTLDAPVDGMGLEWALVELKNKLQTSTPKTSRYYEKSQAAKAANYAGVVDFTPIGSENDIADEIAEATQEFKEIIDNAAGSIAPKKARRGFFGGIFG